MKNKNVGRTGLKVSTICLGTMTYGTQVNEMAAMHQKNNSHSERASLPRSRKRI